MGQAFDETGQLLGEASAETKREVFDKLIEQHPDAAEIRIISGAAKRAAVVPSVDVDEIDNLFSYHKPFGNQSERYEELRIFAKPLAYRIMKYCPVSRERSIALRKLREAVMWANAAIAVNEREG